MTNLLTEFLGDEENIHRNLVTLNLFEHQIERRAIELLETKLQLQLATKLWSPKAENISAGQLALYGQAVKASCLDPRDFYGMDLVERLAKQEAKSLFEGLLLDFSVCVLSADATSFEQLLGERLEALLEHKNDHSTDILAMRTLVVSCYKRLKPEGHLIRHDLHDLIAKLLLRQKGDGSFDGSPITTSLVLQAFLDSGLQKLDFLWNRKAAVDFLNQLDSKNLTSLEAYFVVPAFHEAWSQIGCKHDRLVNTSSTPIQVSREETKNALTALYSWFRGTGNEGANSVNLTLSRWVNVQGNGTKVTLHVPRGSSLMKALKTAAREHTDFAYGGTHTGQGFYVQSLGNLSESEIDKSHWLLYRVNGTSSNKSREEEAATSIEDKEASLLKSSNQKEASRDQVVPLSSSKPTAEVAPSGPGFVSRLKRVLFGSR